MANIVGVTSCITGIAHTYMAAEALEQAGKKLGHNVVVETQGSAGLNPVKQEVIDQADMLIFACDLEVQGKDRFAGKPFIELPVAKALKDGVGCVEAALAALADGTAGIVGEKEPAKAAKEDSSEEKSGGFFGGLFGKK